MTVSELIEYLRTLKQDYVVEICDSTYPSVPIEESNINETSEGTYQLY
ncbi:hypothetical protein [Bacillus sp. T33-2]|nr:hypothetical protein [Bacillus sp. T33-2]